MQNETLRGNAPAAARGAIARDVRLCVACLHENRSGEQSCAACGTSLYLILCGACEAVNGEGALRCHGCGAALGLCGACEAVNGAGALHCRGCGAALGTKASDKPEAAPPAGRTSLVRTEASDERAAAPPARRMNRGRLAWILAAVVVTTAAFAYQYSARTAKADRAQHSGGIEVAPAKSIEPPGRVTPPRTEPKAGAPYVTHTQPADASQTAPSAPIARAAVIQAAPAESVEPPGRVLPPRTPEARPAYPRVTHLRPADASQTVPSAAVVRAAPDAGKKTEAGCGEAVAALGLCNIREKGGGK